LVLVKKSLVRHFTATGFLVNECKVLLHWHPKVQAWLPPGGHINDNEDPEQAVLREIMEETGFKAEVIGQGPTIDFEYPKQVPSPLTIMVEDINDPIEGCHQHIDMIYVCRLIGSNFPLKNGWKWVGKSQLISGELLDRGDGKNFRPPEDVIRLAEYALQIVNENLN